MERLLSNSYNEDGECRRNVIENVVEILRKIKWLKSEYSKKNLSKECVILKMISEKTNILKLVSTKSHEI